MYDSVEDLLKSNEINRKTLGEMILLKEKGEDPRTPLEYFKDLKASEYIYKSYSRSYGLSLSTDDHVFIKVIVEKNETALDILLKLPSPSISYAAAYALFLYMPKQFKSLLGKSILHLHPLMFEHHLFDEETEYYILSTYAKKNDPRIFDLPFKKELILRYLNEHPRTKKLYKHPSLGKTMVDSKI